MNNQLFFLDKEWQKAKLRENRTEYVAVQVFREWKNKNFQKLVWGYYEPSAECTSVIIEHCGEKNPDRIVYYFSEGENEVSGRGFWAIMRRQLMRLYFADCCGFTPVVKWGRHTFYYDSQKDPQNDNVFEYYFKPVSPVSCVDALLSKNLVRSEGHHWRRMAYDYGISGSYSMSDDELKFLAETYKKHIHLNETTREYLKQEVTAKLQGKRMLGVHIRGTDFRFRAANHPVMVTPEEYLYEVQRLFSSGKYDQIFLATDDLDALELFQKNIPADQLVFYQDAMRGSGEISPTAEESLRPLHRYRLGLEVLRDVYALAYCTGLVCGLSQVSFAARYISLSLGREYGDCVVIDKGILTKDSKRARQWKKDGRKQTKKLRTDSK